MSPAPSEETRGKVRPPLGRALRTVPRAVRAFFKRLWRHLPCVGRAQQVTQLQRIGQQLRALLQGAVDGVVTCNEKGRIQGFNEAAERIFGWARSDVIGQSIEILIPEALRAKHRAGMARHLKTGLRRIIGSTVEVPAVRRDGTEVPISISLSAIEDGRESLFMAILRDLSAQKKADLGLRTRIAALEAAADMVVITDLKGRIEYANQAFEDCTGHRPADVVGRNTSVLKSGENNPGLYAALWDTISAGHTWSGELINRRKDGSLYPEEMTVAPVLDAEGKPLRYVAIKRDITERRQIEQALRSALDDAQEATRAKSEFLATMSHEIRTPLNGVIGMADLLHETPLNEEQKEFAQTIRICADGLLSVINNVLDFSKIEAGHLQLVKKDFDLQNLVEDSIEMLAGVAQAKQVEVACILDPQLPAALCGDAGRLRQILVNLVGNAVKFTESGQVILRADVEAEAAGVIVVRFQIEDTGVGISEADRPLLFEPFSQVDGTSTRRFGGTGLGLAICKRLVTHMGGSLGVESRLGEGSTFWFTARFSKAAGPVATAPPPGADLHGKKVLVVDDNATNREILRRQLTSFGLRCECARDAEQALEVLRESRAGDPFSLALLDLHMPGKDGLELAHDIRQDRDIESPRLVMLTSVAELGLLKDARALGIEAFLSKPVRRAQLLKCVSRLPPVAERRPPRGAASSSGVHLARGRALVVEDNLVNQRVAARLLERLGYESDLAVNGAEAVERLEQSDYDVVLMDCQMPVMDGFQTTAAIREREARQGLHTPIVALTANAMEGDEERCLAAGMDAYVAKPVSRDALKAALDGFAIFDERDVA